MIDAAVGTQHKHLGYHAANYNGIALFALKQQKQETKIFFQKMTDVGMKKTTETRYSECKYDRNKIFRM